LASNHLPARLLAKAFGVASAKVDH